MKREQGTVLEMYTVYQSPRDYPGLFVVRQWVVGEATGEPQPGPIVARGRTLAEARRELGCTHNMHWFPRDESDDPSIVESWM